MSAPPERIKLQEYKQKLDKVGCGFCLAKWTQVTIHLQLGETHSCHHPTTHKIPVHELKRNPSALHNTKFKKEKRKEMLEGKRPAECDYCWNVEDNSDQLSDRIFKSNESWSKPYLEEIKNLGWRKDFNPKYVEISFSNACNFKCSYCGPSFSSAWVSEAKKHGPYPTSDSFNGLQYLKDNDRMPIPHPLIKWLERKRTGKLTFQAVSSVLRSSMSVRHLVMQKRVVWFGTSQIQCHCTVSRSTPIVVIL